MQNKNLTHARNRDEKGSQLDKIPKFLLKEIYVENRIG
jgi:hypothetical protein